MKAEEKAALAREAYQKAFDYELQYGCCPQCVLTTVKETIGVVSDETIKASHGLSGGGGLSGIGTCGALSGGLVALSAKRGRDRDKFDKGKCISNFKLGQQLVERFREEFGGTTCQELQQQFTGQTYNLWDAKEYAAFDKAREHNCARATALVTQWVVEML
ncbi:C-GCAxxG-C-C family protein [Thiohalobacter sp. IOR34]|uniref:C-GCAxxG-C-C family protein n=1 Tax=Thiohalobacter sp. IOR34 TaxID=3057176 RepID=UPI0025B1FDA9|nr:C-GCAxxG-C-C family protein [Thiohalobacter sp. IOR34]WJW75396.1 C-GCAxxG-C-C family protein [Thiohalobacter sp. IOR34]